MPPRAVAVAKTVPGTGVAVRYSTQNALSNATQVPGTTHISDNARQQPQPPGCCRCNILLKRRLLCNSPGQWCLALPLYTIMPDNNPTTQGCCRCNIHPGRRLLCKSPGARRGLPGSTPLQRYADIRAPLHRIRLRSAPSKYYGSTPRSRALPE